MKLRSEKLKMDQIILLILIGLVAGILSGMFGIGGGVVIVPALMLIIGLNQVTATGTALAMMIPPVGILAVIHFTKQGNVDFRIAGLLCVGFVFGALGGAYIAGLIKPLLLKKLFAVLLVVVAIRIFLSK